MPDDDKHTLLRQYGCLNRHPERVRDPRFVEEPFFDPRDLLQVKYEMLRAVRVERLPITRGAARFGLSRPACYKAIRAFEAGGFLALLPDKPGPRQAHKLVPDVLAFLADARDRDPAPSMNELVRLARQRFALVVHPRSIARALARRAKKTS